MMVKEKNIWDHWYELEPEKFFDQVGPEKTSQVYTKYKRRCSVNGKKLAITHFVHLSNGVV